MEAGDDVICVDSMAADVEIFVQLNSVMEEVLNFKCISARDQNLEIRITNTGDDVVAIQSYCDLLSEHGATRIDYLYPQGEQTIIPGDSAAFYCFMDENKWDAFDWIVFYDSKGKRYEKSLK